MLLQKKQEKQAKNLQAAKRQHKKDKADLRDTIRLTPDAKLTSRQKRRLSASVQKAKRDGKIPRTAQQTIPYREMCRDGICVVSERFFTKQVQFYDINYQLAQNEDKNLIFENWCDFLNYFDSSIRVQFSFLNQPADMEEQRQSIHIPDQRDTFNSIREEYSDMLKGQLSKGNNGLTKTKYITFGVEADSLKEAKADMFTKRTIQNRQAVTSVDTAVEALAVSIGEKARVDLEYMAGLMGGPEKIPQIVEDLKGIIFKDPATGPFDFAGGGENWSKGWQAADEYLSGNVRVKLAQARAAAEDNPQFAINVEKLEQVQPKDLTATEISVRVGASWIDPEIYQQFMFELLGTSERLREKKIQLRSRSGFSRTRSAGRRCAGSTIRSSTRPGPVSTTAPISALRA